MTSPIETIVVIADTANPAGIAHEGASCRVGRGERVRRYPKLHSPRHAAMCLDTLIGGRGSR